MASLLTLRMATLPSSLSFETIFVISCLRSCIIKSSSRPLSGPTIEPHHMMPKFGFAAFFMGSCGNTAQIAAMNMHLIRNNCNRTRSREKHEQCQFPYARSIPAGPPL